MEGGAGARVCVGVVGGLEVEVGGGGELDGPISTSAQKVARRGAFRGPSVFLWRVEGWGWGGETHLANGSP